MQWRLAPGDRFGDARPWASWQAEVPVIVVQDQSLALLVHGAEPGTVSAHDVSGETLISEGERLLVTVVVTDHEPLSLPTQQSIGRRLDHSCRSWREWSDGIEYDGAWRADVVRSALALKTLFYEPGGAIAAAATTSLPEARGGHKNWDYRYSWVRDSSFTIDAFISLGLHEEVHASVSWILAALREHGPELRGLLHPRRGRARPAAGAGGPWIPRQPPGAGRQPGSRPTAARELRRPVRHGRRYVAAGHLLDQGTARSLADLADQCCDRWTAKDSGIWELESLEHYTISKIGCWVALDRAAALASTGQLPRERARRWASEAAEVRRWVNERCWSDERRPTRCTPA